MIEVSRSFSWEAAHRLKDHDGPCNALHGHHYRAEVAVAGEVDSSGMLIDFFELDTLIGGWLAEHWDHTVILQSSDDHPAVQAVRSLNTDVGRPCYDMDGAPTAENLALRLFEVTTELLADRVEIAVAAVRLWETPTAVAEVRRG